MSECDIYSIHRLILLISSVFLASATKNFLCSLSNFVNFIFIDASLRSLLIHTALLPLYLTRLGSSIFSINTDGYLYILFYNLLIKSFYKAINPSCGLSICGCEAPMRIMRSLLSALAKSAISSKNATWVSTTKASQLKKILFN